MQLQPWKTWVKKSVIRISLAAGLILLWMGAQALIDLGEKHLGMVELEFRLPPPEVTQKKFGRGFLASDVTKVFVSGFFSNWVPDSPDFELRPSGPGVWSSRVKMDSGRNEYKFVFYTRDGGPYWIHMENGDGLTDDYFGGWNNLRQIPEWDSLRQGTTVVFLAGLFSLLLYLIFDSVIRRLLNFPWAFRWKILFSLLPVLLLSGFFLTIIQIPRLQGLAAQSFIQEANWLHGILLRQGVDFSDLASSQTQETLAQALYDYFYPLPIRSEPSKPVNASVGIGHLTVFDAQGELLSFHSRQQSEVFYEQLAGRLGYADLEDYSRNWVGGLLKEQLKNQGGVLEKPEIFLREAPLESLGDKVLLWLQGGDVLVVPILDRGRVEGYFVYDVQYHLFGNAIFSGILMNLVVLGPILLVLGFLLFRTGRVVTSHLETLTGWTQRLVQGDFSDPGKLSTGDEIETLSRNFDEMRKSLDAHQRHLGQLVDERTAELKEERQKSERLLLNILPAEIAEKLKTSTDIIADGHESVSVLFADIVNFSHLASRTGAHALVQFLNRIFCRFDEIAQEFGLEKIKTIGDAYMAAAGMKSGDQDHGLRMVLAAREMLASAQALKDPLGEPLEIRIGLHRGPVVAGVIGTRKFIYDLWGETVNLASRMESHGIPGKIHVSDAFFRELDGQVQGTVREDVDIKGHGTMRTWILAGAS